MNMPARVPVSAVGESELLKRAETASALPKPGAPRSGEHVPLLVSWREQGASRRAENWARAGCTKA